MTSEVITYLQQADIKLKTIPDIEIIEREIEAVLSSGAETINKMSSHIFRAGGKRIRPLLVLYCGLIFGRDLTPELLKAAVAVELVHMASLVHDDIIDESSMRRNRPSVNCIWGNHAAVLCGDYLFAKAFSVLAGNNLNRNLALMVEAIQEMCRGEITQAEERFNPDLSLENYYERIAKKTAILLQCACKSGAIVGGADESQLTNIGEYGLHLGFAYQITDDILDFNGEMHVMGKPKQEDLVQGNLTLPMILLLNQPQYRSWVKELIITKNFSPENLTQIANVLKESGIIGRSFEIAYSHIEKAKYNLRFIADSPSRRYLEDMAEKLKTRTY